MSEVLIVVVALSAFLTMTIQQWLFAKHVCGESERTTAAVSKLAYLLKAENVHEASQATGFVAQAEGYGQSLAETPSTLPEDKRKTHDGELVPGMMLNDEYGKPAGEILL